MKTMSMSVLVIVAMAIIISLLICCNSNTETEIEPEIVELTVDKTELNYTDKNESQEFNISYPKEWRMEADDLDNYLGANAASVKNFIISPAYGKGNKKITVTLSGEVAESYSVDLKIVGENDTKTVKLIVEVNAPVQ